MVHDKINDAEIKRLRKKVGRKLARHIQSAPVFAAPQNIAEREPSVMPDSAGADPH